MRNAVKRRWKIILAASSHRAYISVMDKNGSGHSALIDSLGGTSAVARATGVADQTVSTWRVRGVSWRYRAALATMARRRRIALPTGFLDPDSDSPAA